MQRAELDQALAALALARANFQRAEGLFKRGAGTSQAVDQGTGREAERDGRRYRLVLPLQPVIGPARGAQHRHACLRALALLPASA